MKSYKQKNSKILFKTDEKPKDDKTCEEISKVCLEICRRCENKDENEFPIAKIKELIKLNNKLMDGTENKKINKNYIEFINQNKESLGYFLEKQNEEKEVKNIYEKKKMLFKKFKEDISKYI